MITTSMTIIGVTGTQYQGCVKIRLKLPTTTMGTMTMIGATGTQYQAYHLVLLSNGIKYSGDNGQTKKVA